MDMPGHGGLSSPRLTVTTTTTRYQRRVVLTCHSSHRQPRGGDPCFRHRRTPGTQVAPVRRPYHLPCANLRWGVLRHYPATGLALLPRSFSAQLRGPADLLWLDATVCCCHRDGQTTGYHHRCRRVPMVAAPLLHFQLTAFYQIPHCVVPHR